MNASAKITSIVAVMMCGADVLAFPDVDSMLRRTYGSAKRKVTADAQMKPRLTEPA